MSGKVLVVEDDSVNMKVVLLSLRQCGYTLIQAQDGQEALEMAMREHPDVILMDMRLPKLCGLEVAKKLRQMPAFQQVPIIALTAYAMAGDRETAMQAGFDAYLTKPFNTRELPRVVAEALQGRKRGRI